MHINQQKEQFSHAYVRAVAAVAGFGSGVPEVDDDSIDLTLSQRGGNGTVRSPRLEVQLKCTARDVINENLLHFELTIKNYDDLRQENLLVPRILVVVCIPDSLNDWMRHTEDDMLLRHCGYWCSIRGLKPTDNTSKVTVHIPRANQFTPEALSAIMKRIGTGGLP